MPKRKIEAEVAVDVTGLDKVERLEETAERLSEGVEVGIDVDETSLGRFERELDELGLDKARELRIEFKAQVLEQQIRSSLQALERLEDPIEIQTETANLERAQRELQEVAELASRKYDVDIQIDAKGNARRAADDVERIRQRGEGLQSAIPALRGFTDELGGVAAGAGVASQAAADLGDTALIFGERFGVTGKAQKALTTFGTALGALGIGGVVVGGVVAGLDLLRSRSEKLAERIEATTQAILDQIGVAEEIRGRYDEAGNAYEVFADKLLGDQDDFTTASGALADLSLTIEDLPRVLRALTNDDADALERIVTDAGGSKEAAEAVADLVRQGRDLTTLNWQAAENGLTGFEGASRSALDAIRELVQLSDDLSVNEVAASLLDAFAVSSQEARTQVEALYDEFGRDDPLRVLDAYVRSLDAARDAADDAGDAASDAGDKVADAGERVEASIPSWVNLASAVATELRRIRDDVIETIGGIDAFAAKVDEVDAGISAERTLLDLADAFDRVREATVKVAEAETDADREKAIRDLRREQLRLTEDTLDYLETLEDIPVDKVTTIRAAIDRGQYAEAQRLIDELSQDRLSNLTIDITPQIREEFRTIGIRLSGDSAPQQISTDYGPPPNITINYPPGTPANTAENQLINQARNGDRTPL